MVLDEKNKQLITKNKKINLSSREFLFLSFLIQHKYQACSYNEIMKYKNEEMGDYEKLEFRVRDFYFLFFRICSNRKYCCRIFSK